MHESTELVSQSKQDSSQGEKTDDYCKEKEYEDFVKRNHQEKMGIKPIIIKIKKSVHGLNPRSNTAER